MLAAVVIHEYEERRRRGLPARFERVLDLVPEDQQEALEERAAIMEYDGKLDRPQAEHTASLRYLDDARRGAAKRAGR